MRERKFRAWNTSKNVMVTDNEDKAEEYWDGVWATDVGLVNFRLKYPGKYKYMQYTGLKDKNGKEIYEGDIVLSEDDAVFDGEDDLVGVVRFYEGAFWIEKESEQKAYPLFNEISTRTVLGNIYENPELLQE